MGFVENELLPQLFHALALLVIRHIENPQRFVDAGDDLESGSGVAGEDAPAPRQLYFPDRGAIGLEIITEINDVAVNRGGSGPLGRRQRIGTPVNFNRHFF